MRVTRILDLAVLMLLATALLMPRPNVTVKAGLRPCDGRTPTGCLTAGQRERVAELQAELLGSPASAEAAAELANLFLDAKRPEWALATASAAAEHRPDDYRLHSLRALAHADRFDAEPAHEAAKKALFLCENPPAAAVPTCSETARQRLVLLEGTLRSIRGVDMRKQPYLAKERIFQQLHPVWIPKPKAQAKAKAKADKASNASKAGAPASPGDP